MKHHLLLLLALMPIGLKAQRIIDAESHFTTLEVTLTDGKTIDVPMLAEPRITYTDSLFILTTAFKTRSWPRNKVRGYKFKGDGFGGLDDVAGPNARQPQWQLVNRELRISNLPKESTISLYTPGGMRIMTTRRTGRCTINLARLASGVYLFEINGRFHKIVLS